MYRVGKAQGGRDTGREPASCDAHRMADIRSCEILWYKWELLDYLPMLFVASNDRPLSLLPCSMGAHVL